MKMIFSKNKRAYYDYFVEDKFEAGISLKGNEAASIKKNGCSISEAWVNIENGEVFVNGFHISKYERSGVFAEEPLRFKKLLLHKKEINELTNALAGNRKTIIPLSVYCKDGLIKIEIAICTGKKKFDKRNTIAERDAKRKIETSLKTKE